MAPGLREQKRAATRRALRIALLRLALDRGLDNVTVDEVAQEAGVSPRTFFNYFDSKEQAIAAPSAHLEVDAAERAAYLAGDGDALTDLVHLIAARAHDDEDLEVHRLLRRLMEREPTLMGEKAANLKRVHEQLAELVVERLRLDAERDGGRLGEREARDRAGLVVNIAAAIARHGWTRWAGAEGARSLRESLHTGLEDFAVLAAAALRHRA